MSYTLRLLRCVTGALLAGLLFFGIHQGARADDIDIFTASSTLSAVPPNVLIVLDNSANWSANFGDPVVSFRFKAKCINEWLSGLLRALEW